MFFDGRVEADDNGQDGVDIVQDTRTGANSVDVDAFLDARDNTNRGFAVSQTVDAEGTNSIVTAGRVRVNRNGDEGIDFVQLVATNGDNVVDLQGSQNLRAIGNGATGVLVDQSTINGANGVSIASDSVVIDNNGSDGLDVTQAVAGNGTNTIALSGTNAVSASGNNGDGVRFTQSVATNGNNIASVAADVTAKQQHQQRCGCLPECRDRRQQRGLRW